MFLSLKLIKKRVKFMYTYIELKRERFGEHLRSIRNRSPGLPVAEHFNSANHTIDDIRVCGVKQCSGSNTSRKRREMQLIFELGTLKPGGLNINFSFI